MGGCITEPKKMKQKQPYPKKSRVAQQYSEDQTNIPDSTPNLGQAQKGKKIEIKEQKRRYKRLTSQQLLNLYKIEQNIGTTTKVQGPKFISSLTDGSCFVLRVLNFGQYNTKRLQIYQQLLNLTLMEDQNSNLLIFQQYYCGPTLDELLLKTENEGGSREDQAEQLKNFVYGIYRLIDSFHLKGMVLGNLNLFSFRYVSEFENRVGLTDLNFQLRFDDLMGHAHKEGEQADWESFGFILQTLVGEWPPIYIPHKIQYMDTGNQMINALLKGKKIKVEQINQIKSEEFKKSNKETIAGYKLRRDINKLIKLRKRRVTHPLSYYSYEAIHQDEEQSKKRVKKTEESIHRFETARILNRIETYIEDVTSNSSEAFMNYNDGKDNLIKLQPVFRLSEKQKKMQELKDSLSHLK